MAFTNNEYSISTGDTIGTQFTTAMAVMNSLTSAQITIERPNFADVSAVVYDTQSKWTIKSLMESAAKLDCANYYTTCTEYTMTLKKNYGDVIGIVNSDDYAPLSKGFSQVPINFVRLFQTDMEIPTPNIAEGETLADYGIFEVTVGSGQPTIASTMKIVSPLIQVEYTQQGSTYIPIPNIDTSYFSTMFNGKTFGTEFSCSTVKTPNNSFMAPMSRITFGSDLVTEYYLCNADYFLTTAGIYASISGTGKPLSDYEYVGETAVSIRKKVELEHNYNGSYITADGISWRETEGQEAINSG
jgi:hypothetical protein